MEDVGMFYGHLVYFTAIWYILGPLGTFYGYLVYFFPFWYVVVRKIWQPWRCEQ
jgi:ABC-type spermidine/putrescine transport system permease subunit II